MSMGMAAQKTQDGISSRFAFFLCTKVKERERMMSNGLEKVNIFSKGQKHMFNNGE
ncbi:hypothetical protein [Paenibacillus sp. P22]|uniref:hypothetical protein n=1 Tax=Paenibacillus sp. P22 TaxID=483908 RepID=UPI000434FBE7|nr:hypothetical protein [Paenibacillus sp. P22]CDN45856.1 hypothetical protein BN871_JH_00100 [Paenibacillus sp. P22]